MRVEKWSLSKYWIKELRNVRRIRGTVMIIFSSEKVHDFEFHVMRNEENGESGGEACFRIHKLEVRMR